MRVAVNALHLVPGETGGLELYARRLLPALAAAGVDLVVHAAREGAPSLRQDGLEVVEVPVNARSRPRRVLAEQSLLPRAVRRSGADLLHNLFSTAPARPGVPQVTTIHDVNYRTHPEAHLGVMAYGLELLVPLAARRSERVIAVSETAKWDLVRLLGIDPTLVDVAPNGPGLPEADDPPGAAELRARFEVGAGPLVLTVTALRPHKNVDRLLEALALVPDAVLVAPGYATSYARTLRAHAAHVGVGDRVRLPGWVDDATLDGLYRACDAFVFPSLAEGFGLPVLEAMRRGVPVACSDIPVLREVAGDVADYFDPHDAEAMAAAIRNLLAGQRSGEAGRERARRFTWEAAARATVACYERARASARS